MTMRSIKLMNTLKSKRLKDEPQKKPIVANLNVSNEMEAVFSKDEPGKKKSGIALN